MVGKNQNNNTINQQENLDSVGQINSQYNNMQPQSSMQQQNTYGNYFEIQKVQKKSPILGIISLILVFIAFIVSVFLPVRGIVLSILIITLDIIALVRKEKAIILPIMGIVLGTLVFLFSGLLALVDLTDFTDFTDLVDQVETLQPTEGQDVFSGRILIMSDGSALYFQEDGTYSWYQNDLMQDDNYYAGSYKAYNDNAAEDYLITDLSQYGIEKEELEDFYRRNSEDEFYTKENLYCIALNCNYRIVGGEESKDEDSLTPYYGFSDGINYDLANMNTGNYLTIERVESIEEK